MSAMKWNAQDNETNQSLCGHRARLAKGWGSGVYFHLCHRWPAGLGHL